MGKDKRWIEVDGSPLLLRTCSLLKSLLGTNPVIAGDNFESNRYAGCRIIADEQPGKGPLGGLVACLKHCQTPWVLAMPVDMPNLTAADIRILADAIDDDCDVILFESDSAIQPLPAIFNVNTLSFLKEKLQTGNLALHEGLKELKLKSMPLDHSAAKLFNLNTPANLLSLSD
jgi:molybdopterin-guanine dinucleotide biosynthesis protein A